MSMMIPPDTPEEANCFAASIKRGPMLPEGIRFEGQRTLAKYGASWKDASKQASDQMFNRRNYLEGRIGRVPFIVDFVLLTNRTEPR